MVLVLVLWSEISTAESTKLIKQHSLVIILHNTLARDRYSELLLTTVSFVTQQPVIRI